MGTAIKAAWLEGENYLTEENIYLKNTLRGNVCQPGDFEPVNQSILEKCSSGIFEVHLST